MTTIVYCHKTKQIACDSQVSIGDTIATDSEEKFRFFDGEMWFFAGSICDNQSLIDIHHKKIDPFDADCTAIVANKDGVFCRTYSTNNNRYMPYALNYSWAIGSGTDHALTALDMGATAKQAVEMAIKRDVWSGGKVRVFDCLAMEFIE